MNTIRPTVRRLAAAALPLGGVVAAGCLSIPKDAGFADVQARVADRSPDLSDGVRWDRDGDSDAATRARVDALLAGELSADGAVRVALLGNRGLQATYESLAVAQADLVRAGLLRNPVLDAQVRFGEGGGGTGVDVGIVQDFLDVFQIPLRKRVAAADFDAAKDRVAGAAIDLAADVRRTYYRLVAARQTVGLRRTVVAAHEASYDVARRLREAGNITELALVRERGQWEQSKLDLASAETDAVVRREQLNALMGVWGGRATAWAAPDRLPDAPPDEVDSAGLERTAVAHSLNLARLRQQVYADVSRLGLSSNFSLLNRSDLAAGVVAERSGEGGDWETGPAFALPIPLFDAGGTAVYRARAVVRQANRRYEQEAVNLRAGVRAAYAQLVGARDRAEYYRRVLVPIRGTILDQTQLTYNAMLVGPFELLQARRDQVEAATAYIASLRTYWLARTALDQILAGRSGGFPAMAPADADDAGASMDAGGDGH